MPPRPRLPHKLLSGVWRAAQRHRHICAQAKPEGTPAVAARIYERRPRTEAGPLCWPSPRHRDPFG
jgi:hypothetical protein